MISFDQFKKSILSEALTASQKTAVNKWSKGDNSFSDHMFTNPKDDQRQSFELEDPNKSEHQEVVKSHLEPHGFKIKDYVAGKAEDKHGREVNIGKALGKVKAPNDVLHKFQNDPSRQQKDAEDLHLSISRHPHDVAGMTSEGHSWENESCMNFKTGSNRHYLKDDIKHGTHVAYLTDKDDKKNERPLARIALKKYTNIDNPNDHILRPEDRTYGNAPDKFSHTLNKAINKHFPGDDNAIYEKDENVYNDSGQNYIVGKNKLFAIAYDKESDPYLATAAAKSKDLKPHHIDKMLDHPNYHVKSMAIKNPNASSENLHKALDMSDMIDLYNVVDHPNVKPEHLDRLINSNNSTHKELAAKSQKLSPDQIEKLSKSKNYLVHANLATNDKTPKHILDKYINKNSDVDIEAHKKSLKYLALGNKNVDPEKLHDALKEKLNDVESNQSKRAALKNPNIKPEHINTALDDTDPSVRETAAAHYNVSSENLHKALDDDDFMVRNAAITNKKATPKHLIKALNDKLTKYRALALEHKNVNSEVLDKASDNSEPYIRAKAYAHENASHDLLMKGLDDPNPILRGAVLDHKKINTDHIIKASKDHNAVVRYKAFKHKLAKKLIPVGDPTKEPQHLAYPPEKQKNKIHKYIKGI